MVLIFCVMFFDVMLFFERVSGRVFRLKTLRIILHLPDLIPAPTSFPQLRWSSIRSRGIVIWNTKSGIRISCVGINRCGMRCKDENYFRWKKTEKLEAAG